MIFSESEIQQFVTDGYVILRGGFSAEIAEKGRDHVCAHAGVDPDDPSSWSRDFIHIQDTFSDGPFAEILNDRILGAVDELAGTGRAFVHGLFGWWPLLFPGFEGPGGWHIDGSSFHHYLRSRHQALVTLYLFTDIEPGDGGTALFRGSHHEIARIREAAEPDGLSFDQVMERLPEIDLDRHVEVTGRAGDVAFLHPFLIHGFGANRGSKVRVACNPQYPFHTEMDLDRPDGDHSPVEEAIRVALGWNAAT